MAFYNDLQCNSLDAQSIHANDEITCPSIEVGGVKLTALDLNTGVTVSYLENEYLKKGDGTVLKDITAGTSGTIFTKDILAPNANISGSITAPTMTTSMQSTGPNNVPNLSYLTGNFAGKAVTYTKSEVDTFNAAKVGTVDFNNYQSQVSTALSIKAPISSVYTTAQVDQSLQNKVDSSTFVSAQSSTNTALAGKLNIGDVYTKSEQDNLNAGKASVQQLADGLATKVNTSTFSGYQTTVSSSLATKADTSALTSGLALKADRSNYDTFVSSTNASLSERATLTDLSNTTANLTNIISTKQNTADSYTRTAIDNLILQRVTNSDFNTYKGTVTSALADKVTNSEFTAFKSDNTAAIALKSDISSVYPKAQTYTRTEVDTIAAGKQATFSNASNLSVIDQSVATLSSPTFNNVTSTNPPVNNNHLVTKSYVDAAATAAGASTLAGTGLTKTGNTLSVNAAQTQITSVGTLGSLSVSGGTVLNGLAATRVDVPYSSIDDYITGFRLVSTGAGNGNYLQTHNARTSGNFEPLHITDHSATSIKASFLADKVNIPLTTTSISSSTGALTLAGGLGVSKDAYFGGNCFLTNSVSGSNSPNLFLNNNAGATNNTVSIGLNPNANRSGGSSVLLQSTDDGAGGAFFAMKVATGASSAVASQILKATSSSLQVNGALSSTSLTTTGPIIGTSGTYSSVLQAPSIGVNVNPSGTYPMHILSPAATDVSILRLAMPNLGVPTPISTSIVYGIDAFGVNDIAAKISFIRTQSSLNGRTEIAFSTTWGGTANTDYSVERMRIAWDGVTSISCTTDSSSTTSGALLVSGGAGIAKGLTVGTKLMVNGTTDIDNNNVATTSASVVLDGGFAVRKQSAFGGNIFVKGAVYPVASDGRILGAFSMFGASGSEPLPTFTSFNATTAGQFDFWDTVGSGTKSLAIRKDVSTFSGKLAASNIETGVLVNGSSQAGVTMTKSADNNFWARTGRIIESYINLTLTAISGTQSGNLTFTLPYPCALTTTMDNVSFISRNGAQQTNMRFNFTQGSTTVTLSVNNGLGAFVATTPGANDTWSIILTYPANTGTS